MYITSLGLKWSKPSANKQFEGREAEAGCPSMHGQGSEKSSWEREPLVTGHRSPPATVDMDTGGLEPVTSVSAGGPENRR